jgi:sugar lactone lactonase YvrE
VSSAAVHAGLVLADDLVWAESPRLHGGRLWVSDTQRSRLVVLGPEGRTTHALDTAVNGTGFLPGGDLVGARMCAKRVDRFDGTTWSVHADLTGLVEGRLGDLIALPDGSVYVDEVHTPDVPGRLLRLDPDGGASVAAEELVFPNGLALVDGGATLVVAETFAARLTAFTVGADGALTDRRPWFDLGERLGETYRPDGICAAADDSIWVAATTAQTFLRLRGGAADGEVVERIDVDGFAIACWPDEDGGALYGTSGTSLDPDLSVMEAAHQQRTQARVTRFTTHQSNRGRP